MARIRTIKPSFFTSLTVAQLTTEQRLTFVGLWTYADDEGRGVDDARLIRAAVWPLDDRSLHEIDTDMDALSKVGLVVRYRVQDRRYFEIGGWKHHQRVSHPTPSDLPPTTHPDAEMCAHSGISPEPSRTVPESFGNPPENFGNGHHPPADQHRHTPESPPENFGNSPEEFGSPPEKFVGERKGKEGKGKEGKGTRAKPPQSGGVVATKPPARQQYAHPDWTPLPDGWTPPVADLTWAQGQLGRELADQETAAFVAHYRDTEERRGDWTKVFRAWVRDRKLFGHSPTQLGAVR